MEMAAQKRVLYVSGEESERQIKMRATRLVGAQRNGGAPKSSKDSVVPLPKDLMLVTETNLEVIFNHVREVKPDILIIDSIQTVYLSEKDSSAGSVSQVRECSSQLRELAKTSGISVFIVGHVTKEGTIAGPRVLEHIVDTVLYLEGDHFQAYRLLRSVKNRFGATSEVGVFEMLEGGLSEVTNPSEAFLAERMINAAGSAIAVTMEGTRPILVEVQGLTSPTQFGNARRTANGVDFNRLLLISAVLTRRAGFKLSEQDIFVNVVGGLQIDEPAADLAVAAAIASSWKDVSVKADAVLIGEIGLAGGDYCCIGSVAELEELTGRELSELDLHRPAVDDITFKKNGKTWQRVPEVIDCWFDSGAMPYAQWHYPFENKDKFEAHFPADYICEAIDQTRGWFYTLHAISTLVSDSVSYKNCICLNLIVDKDGKKMSKSQGNIINPYDVFDTVGADALRWYFLARLSPDVAKRISVDIVADVASSFVNTFWNTYGFFVLYARLDGIDLSRDVPVNERPEIDRWAMALTHRTITVVTNALDNFDAKTAGEAIEAFVDQLSNWYVRRNRRRFWKSTDPADKHAAYLTLYQCLDAAHKLMAPFVPFLAENVYQNLVRTVAADAPVSVHMTDWPLADPAWQNDALLDDLGVVQKLVGLGRAARGLSGVRTRQPLSRLLVRAPDDASAKALAEHADQILEELNVKAIEFIARDAGLVSYRIKPNLPVLGRRYGKLIPQIKKALDEADGAAIAAATARGDEFSIVVVGDELKLCSDDVLIETSSAEGYACAEDAGYLAALDTSLNEDLLAEGIAREIVRSVQDARKQAGLEVSDRIRLGVSGSDDVATAIAAHRDYLMNETLATEWRIDQDAPLYRDERQLGDSHWRIEFSKRD
jgi:DNA repair protein RadA